MTIATSLRTYSMTRQPPYSENGTAEMQSCKTLLIFAPAKCNIPKKEIPVQCIHKAKKEK